MPRLSGWLLWPCEFEQTDNFGIRELMEIAVELADSKEHRRRAQAHDFVHLIAQRLDGIGRCDRNREDHFLWPLLPNSSQRGAYRSAGRDAIVDDDHGAILELDARAPAAIDLIPAMDFLQLVVNLAFQIVARDAQRAHHFAIENRLRMIAVDHRADPQLGLAGRAELAHDDHIERRIQRARDLEGHRNAAARHAQNDRILRFVFQQSRGELAAGVDAVIEDDVLIVVGTIGGRSLFRRIILQMFRKPIARQPAPLPLSVPGSSNR